MIIATQNVAASAKGWMRKTYVQRFTHVRDGVAHYRPDVLCVQESGSGKYLKRLDAEMKRVGLVRAKGGGRWRHIYYNPNTMLLHQAGLFTLNRLGTKHAAWAKLSYRKTGHTCFVTSVHLSHGGEQVAGSRYSQAETLLRKALAKNPRQHPEIHAGDFNSHRLVGKVVMEPRHFHDARDVARLKRHVGYDTFNGRDTVKPNPSTARMAGNHLDHIYVDRDLVDDVNIWTQRPSTNASDHNIVAVTVRL